MARLSEVAKWVGADTLDTDTEITCVSAIDVAGPQSLVFATDPRALEKALHSSAGGILANRAAIQTSAADRRLLEVRDPKLAFAVAAARLRRAHDAAGVHPRAIVDEAATVGKGTRIGPGAVIGPNVTLGSDCEIYANATIYPGTTLGDRVIVQSGAVLGSTGFGYVRDSETGEYIAFPQQGTLEVEDDVEIGANTTIDRGALGATRVGRGTKIDNLVHVAHNCVIGRNVVIAAQTGISGSTVVGDHAIIGGQVGVGDHAIIGEGVILGSGSGVLSNKKLRGSGQVFWGIPAQPLKQYLRDLARFRQR